MLLLFCCPAMSDSLWPHGLQHTRLPCPSPSPEVCPSSCPLHQWYHPAIILWCPCLLLVCRNTVWSLLKLIYVFLVGFSCQGKIKEEAWDCVLGFLFPLNCLVRDITSLILLNIDENLSYLCSEYINIAYENYTHIVRVGNQSVSLGMHLPALIRVIKPEKLLNSISQQAINPEDPVCKYPCSYLSPYICFILFLLNCDYSFFSC